jgi:hypothetical protein
MLRKNAVIDQNVDNILKTTKHELGCCDGDAERDCQHTASYTQTNSVSVLTIEENGQSVALACVIAGNATAATAETTIKTTLATAGYYEDDNGAVGITVVDSGANLDITIVGDINVVSLTHSGGTATFTAKCVKKNICVFSETGFTAGAGSTMHINGASQSIGDITPGTTNAATVKASVEAALLAEGITSVATVTTVGSGASQTYSVSVTNIPSNTTLYLLGASGVKFYLAASSCVQTYTA